MTYRVTKKRLDHLVGQINELAGFPEGQELWTREGDSNIATVGMYYVEQAYGGVQLHRLTNKGGGVTCPIGNLRLTKRELELALEAFIEGIKIGRG